MYSDYLKVLPQLLIPKRLLTFLAGKLAELENPFIKNWLIRQFIKKFKVNMQEAQRECPSEYKHFNDFFIRQLKPGLRPLSDADILSPVDGQISEIGRLDKNRLIQAKGHDYTANALLGGDEDLAKQFLNGYFATIYLAPKDYHRIHMPMDGALEKTLYLPGRLHSVQPATASVIPQLFAKNERLVTVFNTEKGKVAIVLVGAAIVAAIGTTWGGDIKRIKKPLAMDYQNQGIKLSRGAEMGYFKLGSTVILLFEKAANLNWFDGLTKGSLIKLGMPLANAALLSDGMRDEKANSFVIS